MILKDTILSVFNDKYTLLKWLKQLDKALKDDTLTSVTVNQAATDKVTLSFNFEGGGSIVTPEITLPRGADGRQGINGEKGEKGDKGDKGDTALSVQVEGTYTAPAGTQASVTNVGTNTDLELRFVIPQGAKGDTGATGATGARGATGETGATGAKGEAATVEVGIVTTLPAGDRATVTNAGTENAAIFNFGIPQGEKGDSGEGGFADVTNLDLTETIDTITTVDNGVQINSQGLVDVAAGRATFPVSMIIPVKGSETIVVDIDETNSFVRIKIDPSMIDTTPTADSAQLITSGGVYTALQGKLNATRADVATVGGLVKPLSTPTATELVGISTGMEQERVKIGDGLNYDTNTKTLTATGGGGGGTGGTKLYKHDFGSAFIITIDSLPYSDVLSAFKSVIINAQVRITGTTHTDIYSASYAIANDVVYLYYINENGQITPNLIPPMGFTDTVTPL